MALLTAALAALLATGCGGSSADSSSDPQELLNETFNGDTSVDSGVIDITVDASTQGGAQEGAITGTIQGPFQSNGSDKLPSLALDAGLQVNDGGQTQAINGTLTVTSDGLYISTGDKAYQLDDSTFAQLEASYAQSAQDQAASQDQSSAIFSRLGVDPSTWLTDVTNEGTEDVDGVETVHISGTPDIAKVLTDAQKLDPTGSTAAVGDASQIAKTVKSASMDVYTGADDKILRRLTVQIDLQDPNTGQTVTLKLDISLSGVNEDQDIQAPANPEPLDQLIPGGLGSALGATGLGGSAGTGTTGQTGGISPSQYTQCLQSAATPDQLSQCLNQS